MNSHLDKDLKNLKKISREYILKLSCWWCRWRNVDQCYNKENPKFRRKKNGKSTLIITSRLARNCKNFKSVQFDKIKGFGYSPLSMREQESFKEKLVKPI